jgi:hypothetical protein
MHVYCYWSTRPFAYHPETLAARMPLAPGSQSHVVMLICSNISTLVCKTCNLYVVYSVVWGLARNPSRRFPPRTVSLEWVRVITL